MYLRAIHFRRFKSLRSVDLELGPLNILTGLNNGGKATFFSALRLLDLAVTRARRRRPDSARTPAGCRLGLRVDTDSGTTSVANVHIDLIPKDTTVDYVLADGQALQLWFPPDGGCILLGAQGTDLPPDTRGFCRQPGHRPAAEAVMDGVHRSDGREQVGVGKLGVGQLTQGFGAPQEAAQREQSEARITVLQQAHHHLEPGPEVALDRAPAGGGELGRVAPGPRGRRRTLRCGPCPCDRRGA